MNSQLGIMKKILIQYLKTRSVMHAEKTLKFDFF